jgi:hypothetical protein
MPAPTLAIPDLPGQFARLVPDGRHVEIDGLNKYHHMFTLVYSCASYVLRYGEGCLQAGFVSRHGRRWQHANHTVDVLR